MSTRTVTQQCVIGAAPDTVAAAIASPHGLSGWMCDQGRSEKREGGRLSMNWLDGRQTVGRWTVYEPPERLSWHSREDLAGPEHTVSFELAAEGEGTKVTASESEVGESEADTVAAEWRLLLDDLKLFVEQGLNGREMRQPMLGIMPEELDAESADRVGVPIEKGIRISGLADDGAAGAAGMATDDVIVSIDDAEVTDWGSLGGALRTHQAGDTVNVQFWRGNEENQWELTLKPRELPDIPESIDGIKAEVAKFAGEMSARFDELFDGVTEAEASHKPSEDEWNTKEVLVHLSQGERFSYDWLLRMAGDAQAPDWAGEGFEIMSDALKEQPVEQLLARFRADLLDTQVISLEILDRDPTPWVRRYVASNGHWSSMHTEDHINQIKEALASARS